MLRILAIAICVCVIAPHGARAGGDAKRPPPRVIDVEVRADQVNSSDLFDGLPWSDVEPGGRLVPRDAAASWFAIGLKPGDVIVREGGRPVGNLLVLAEGGELLEIVRDGRTVLLRVTIHGEVTREVVVDDAALHSAARRAIATPIKRDGHATGVRMLDDELALGLSVGDLVRSLGGKQVTSDGELRAALDVLPVGKTTVRVERDGVDIEIELERKDPVALTAIHRTSATAFELPRDVFRALRDDVETWQATAAFTTTARGVAVAKIAKDSPLAALGIQDGDLLIDLDGVAFAGADLSSALLEFHIGHDRTTLPLHLERRGKAMTISYQIR
jgi:S1-C subfamily serine protease